MPMKIPVGRGEVDLDVSDDPPPFLSDFKDRIAEVGSGPEVPYAGADDRNLAAAARGEPLRTKGRVIPDRLDVSFGNCFHCGSFLR